MDKTGMHFIIKGRVQGVFFRDSTRTKAIELGVTGWVRNSPEGHVECQAFGTPEQLSQLETWLWEGSRSAEVSNVSGEVIPYEEIEIFDIRYQPFIDSY